MMMNMFKNNIAFQICRLHFYIVDRESKFYVLNIIRSLRPIMCKYYPYTDLMNIIQNINRNGNEFQQFVVHFWVVVLQ